MRLINVIFPVAVACLVGSASGAEAQTINACVMKNGLMKVVDDESDCGPQESPISLGQSQPAVETARVFDSEGRDIGAFLDMPSVPTGRGLPVGTTPYLWRVLLADAGVVGILNRYTGSIDGSIPIMFSDLDCEGRGYASTFWSNTLIPDPRSPGAWFIGSKSQFSRGSIAVQSTLHINGSCENYPPQPVISTLITVEEYTNDLGLTFPLPLPMWIGSSSAVSP